eukprot:TRINITY_DN31630_c0_g1_i1.p1 TRINITY_DN31630_c0_g1~~TRINITY_DN31630_c0_g1_i1.p1  ORF type:complete len:529 (+),score=159.39 TRINITY_DN31630_c0_g1_i1:352-1938(+)
MWWSPDGSKLAILRSDESMVDRFTFSMYPNAAYTEQVSIPYPKSGFPNPTVTLMVYDAAAKSMSNVTVPVPYEYVTWVGWDAGSLFVKVMNRTQNRELTFRFDGAASSLVLTLTDDAWIDTQPLVFVNNGAQFVTIAANPTTHFDDLALFDADGTHSHYLLAADYDVTAIAGYHAPTNTLYYSCAKASPTQRQLFKINLDTQASTEVYKNPGWSSASFSSGDFFLVTYAGGADPGTDVPQQILLSAADPDFALVLQDNSVLGDTLATVALPTKEFITITSADGVTQLNAYVLKPPGFDPSKKYGVMLNVYGGPGSQTVMAQYGLGFNYYVCSQLNVIVASVDGRGTGARGNTFKKQTYLKLGMLEVADQIAAANYFAKQSYVDSSRIGIWGWSYGGYMTALAISDPSGTFKYGVSVAPVTDWRFYDSVYTERYMQTPDGNPAGYNGSSVLGRASAIQPDSLLLVHGSADDNVHFQNSMIFENMLIASGVQFRSMVYPNRDHGIADTPARRHLYQLISDFVRVKAGSPS